VIEATNGLIKQAQVVLAELGFGKSQTNQRSALTLLSLLELKPGDSWKDATRELHGVTPMMDWIGEHLGKRYMPNSREAFRKETLHQFVDAALVVRNPDDPQRAINSQKTSYQVDATAHKLLRKVGSKSWSSALAKYLVERPGLEAEYAAARDRARIPVALPDGSVVQLTPGGQNKLLRAVLEEFCARWTGEGRVLYIGDAGRDDPIFEEKALEELGVKLDKHGKLPDLIVHLPKKRWLVLLEAVSSQGPIDAKRKAELERLFGDSKAGLVYVTCFPNRTTMRRFLPKLAWETEAWCADAPEHLIHFNGERFLGPYKGS
jgi:hypothetical protein